MPVIPLLFALVTVPVPQQPDSIVLVDLAQATTPDWFVVNDGVMGGVSSSTMQVTPEGTGVFAGDLSLENNGGFASVRTALPPNDLTGCAGLTLRVRGDGRRYQVRLHTDTRFDAVTYRAEFDTAAGTWITVSVPFAEFTPTYRGSVPRGAPPLDLAAIRQLGLLIADGQEAAFRLEVGRIVAVRDLPADP